MTKTSAYKNLKNRYFKDLEKRQGNIIYKKQKLMNYEIKNPNRQKCF